MRGDKGIWDFPPNYGGVSYGLTDAARAYFLADRLRHVTREVIQNSLDSHNPSFPIVDVEVADCTIPKKSFGGEQLATHFSACIEEVNRVGATNSQRDVEVLEQGLELLKSPEIHCLRIVDSGTNGLRPPNWHALVESEGIVQKEAGLSGGSFGIGKNAVFAISDIFAVIYSTRYLDRKRGRVEKCQGKARLMTHAHPKLNQSDIIPSPKDYLQNTGFFRSKSMAPLIGRKEIPDEFRLHATAGTGIYVLGFNPHSQDWVTDVRRAVCESFFMAIHNQRLRVTIRPVSGKPLTVDHETIDEILARSESSEPFYYFYKAIRRDQADHTTRSVQPLGKLDVFLDPSNGPSRTAYINRKGMLITASSDQRTNPVAPRRRVTWTDYTGVVIPQTDQGDLWVRDMESPAHDAIQPDQLPEPEQQQQAKTVFKNVRRQLRTIIDSEMEARFEELSENLSELARYLPEKEGEELKELSEQYLSVTKVQNRPQDTQFLERSSDEEIGPGQITERSDSSAGSGNNGRIEGETGELRGRRKRAIPRIPVQDPRVIPVDTSQLRVIFTPLLQGQGSIAITVHPRGYEATVEPAIALSKAECISPDEVQCALLEEGKIRFEAVPDGRISMHLTTTQPIEQITAFDLVVREDQ